MRADAPDRSGTAFDLLVILDFEATCQEGAPPDPQEVIEFPSVLVSLRERAVIAEFESFVRPVHHPRLTPFCSQLTSITQADVEAAPTFPEVLAAHQRWLEGERLLGPNADPFAFVTCGDWDLVTMLPAQCAAADIDITTLPAAYRRWINIKQLFAAVTNKRKGFGMPTMLRTLGLTLEGRHHRGIDDCRNIAKIAVALRDRGARFELTSTLPASRYPPLPLTLLLDDDARAVVLTKRAMPTLLGLASGEYRRQIVHVTTEDGARVTDEALLELAPGTTLLVTPKRRK
ncbi:MAG: 3'-5' exonuclease [Nannocystaceae bacterium]